MKSMFLKLVGVASLAFAVIVPSANAASIDTGVAAFMVSGPGVTGGPASSVTPNNNWYGGTNFPASPGLSGGNSWISLPGFTSGTQTASPGLYTFTTTVELAPGQTGSITGKLAADNTVQYGLAGGLLSSVIPVTGIVGFQTLYDFTVTGLTEGLNTIRFLVTNAPGGGTNPMALLVTQSDVSAVPLPAAAWLFGSALLGLVTVARRRAAI